MRRRPRKGVEDGTYYLSLTMPADFSERIASSSGDTPETGALQVRTNDANNYIVGQISRTVFSEVRSAASTNASRSFLDRIFVSFSDIHDATKKAAKGADQLKGGIGKAKKGSKDLADGLEDAKKGSGDLAGGIKKLNKGAGDLESGSKQVADGTQLLADKVNGVAGQVRPFLKDNKKAIGDTARLVADSAKGIRHNLDVLVKTAPTAAKGAHAGSDVLDGVYKTRCETLPLPDPACPDLKKAKVAAADVAKVADDLNVLIEDDHGDLDTLDRHLATLQRQSEALAKHAPTLDQDVATAVSKINALNKGAGQVAEGAKQLHTGLGTAKTGSADLDTGVGKLKTGASDLNGGMFQLADGSGELAGGLHDGVKQIPDYDKKDRDAAHRCHVRPGPARLSVPAQGAQLRHRIRPVLHPAVPVGRRDGGLHADPAAQPARTRRGRLRLADRAGRLAARGRARGAPGGRPDVGAALGARAPDGQGGRNGRLPVPRHGVLRRDRAVAERPLRSGGADPRTGLPDAPVDVGGRHVSRADEPRILQRDPPLPADDLRRRGAAETDLRRWPRTRVAGVCRARRVHGRRAGPDRPQRPQQAGVDTRPAAPRTEPVSAPTPPPVRIRGMESSTRRQATRQKLYEAAVTLIAEQGFSATTVDEIAERAGVAKGTVYYNFASKSVLFEELLRHGVGLLTASLREASEKTAASGGSKIDALDAMIRAGLVFIDRYPAFTQLYVAELWRTNRAWQSTLAVVRQEAVAVVEDVLRDAVEGGELSEEIDIPLTAAALVGMVLVAALDWQAFQPERSLDDVHAALSRLLQGRVTGGR